MGSRSLEAVVQSVDSVVETFRRTDVNTDNVNWDVYRSEYTHWIEEQRAWQETGVIMDQTHHLAVYYIEGPDALAVNADLGVADISGLRPADSPVATQHPVCNPDGYLIGDPILFYFDDDTVAVTGNRGHAQKWIQYHVETGAYDARLTDVYNPYEEGPPVEFRLNVQGPNAGSVMDAVTDGPVPDIAFFEMDEISIDGIDLYLLGHGMASVPGYEIFGPYEHHEEIKDAIFAAGQAYGIRKLGSRAHRTATLGTGWLPTGLPAVYENEQMKGYREWLDGDCIEARWSLGGSFESDDPADYYLDPVSLGYEHLIDFDHDFVGSDALAELSDNPERQKVTFVWDDGDVIDLYASLFRDGESYKYFDLPGLFQQWDLGHYDTVTKDGDQVGLSMIAGFDYNQREMLSLGVIDTEYSAPGTTVSVVWGEEASQKRRIERHVETDVRATTAPAPYIEGRTNL